MSLLLFSQHFAPWEVAPDLEESLPWDSEEAQALPIDPLLLVTWDGIRDLLDVPIIVNDYCHGGDRRFCGIRTPASADYSPGSQHSVVRDPQGRVLRPCRALDGHPSGMSAWEARSRIRGAIQEGKLPHLGGMEVGIPWLHADVRARTGGRVAEFGKPATPTA